MEIELRTLARATSAVNPWAVAPANAPLNLLSYSQYSNEESSHYDFLWLCLVQGPSGMIDR